MLLLISGIALAALVRVVHAAIQSLSALPKSNRDWIWY